jgi:hypothetical protein
MLHHYLLGYWEQSKDAIVGAIMMTLLVLTASQPALILQRFLGQAWHC